MTIRTSPWPAGVPCWADLSVPDVEAAKAFYAEVLGWSYRETAAEFGGYVVAQARDAAAAGIGRQQQAGPAAWTLFMASDDADKTAAAIAEHGGTVLVPPGDVGPLGRMLVATDPGGAAFGVWQAGEMIGAGIVNEPGGITWEDLRSPEPERAWEFYQAVFGYRLESLPDAGPQYKLFSLPGEQAPLGGMGGMMGMTGMPAHWLVYFAVADTAAAVAAAERAGGHVIVQRFDSPYGTMAGLADPAGAVFWVVESTGENQPDREG